MDSNLLDEDGDSVEWQSLPKDFAPRSIDEGRPLVVRTPGIRRLLNVERHLRTGLECEWKGVPQQNVWWPHRPLPVAVESFFDVHSCLTMLCDGRYVSENLENMQSACGALLEATFVRSRLIKGCSVVETLATWSDLVPTRGGVTFQGMQAPTFTQAFFEIVKEHFNASDGMLGSYPDDVLEWLHDQSRVRPQFDAGVATAAYARWLQQNRDWDFRVSAPVGCPDDDKSGNQCSGAADEDEWSDWAAPADWIKVFTAAGINIDGPHFSDRIKKLNLKNQTLRTQRKFLVSQLRELGIAVPPCRT